MTTNKNREKDDLLEDLERSINKALDARMTELAGALYRLQGSAQGWCDHADCGTCPLAPMMCVIGLDQRVSELIEAHHAGMAKPVSDISPTPIREKPVHDRPNPKTMPDATVKLYASRLHRQLGAEAPAYISEKIRSINPSIEPGRAKDWKRIRAALTTVALDHKFGRASQHKS